MRKYFAVLQMLHSCIINLVIGTLYCAKQNYEFGISRVIKALDPLDQKLETDTWFYAKRCILGLLDGLAKHMLFLNDKSLQDISEFLWNVSVAGATLPASVTGPSNRGKCISHEAILLRNALEACLDMFQVLPLS
jgi:tetratricopeptide repeat protein 30